MANNNAPRGFILARTGGKEPVRRTRNVDSSNATPLAVGDGYIVDADGNISRAGDEVAPNGIVESFEIGAKSGEGPESLDYLPASTAGTVIGIEDKDAEFECQIDTIAATDFDAGQVCTLQDTAPDATLRQSRQSVNSVGSGDDFLVVGLVNRPGNAVGAYAKILVKLVPANVL